MRQVKNDPIMNPISFGNHLVPGIWQYMLPKKIFELSVPDEREATCMDCPKIITEDYRPDYRCCTYYPRIPNYALGFALQSKTGKNPVKRLIEGGHVVPEGSMFTPKEWVYYLADNKNERFGRSDKILCHLLDPKTGFCNIYAFRNSVCSTFFCLNDHGQKGSSFWEAVETLVGQVEAALGQWSLQQMGFDVQSYIKRFNKLGSEIRKTSGKNHRGWSRFARRQLFAEWYGKEIELFEGCAKVISDHRDQLWKIAKEQDILEPTRFDRAQLKSVPKKYEDEIDPEDYEIGEAASPSELWGDLKRTHKQLWALPQSKLVLNSKVQIIPNAKDDRESRHFQNFPYVLLFFARKTDMEWEWRSFISKDDVYLLKKFRHPQPVNQPFLKKLNLKSIASPEKRISEWYRKKVLRKA